MFQAYLQRKTRLQIERQAYFKVSRQTIEMKSYKWSLP